MKTRVTITLDPAVLRRAKIVARSRRTNVSALIEELLRRTADHATMRHTNFTQKWAGTLSLRETGHDDLLEAMKDRYGLER
jgi:Family of unknown function (DUF6364)